ncbi:MAG TPA: YbjN domain-containing protein [Ktedonobacterales bacterium]
MDRLIDTVIQYLEEDDWKFTRMEGEDTVVLTFNCANATYICYAQAREAQQQVVFYTIYPVRAPEEKRLLAAEFTVRVNYGLVLGNLELDMNDGEVRYKTSVDIAEGRLSLQALRSLMQTNLSTADRYYPAFVAMLYSNVTPAEAVTNAERRIRLQD